MIIEVLCAVMLLVQSFRADLFSTISLVAILFGVLLMLKGLGYLANIPLINLL